MDQRSGVVVVHVRREYVDDSSIEAVAIGHRNSGGSGVRVAVADVRVEGVG